jgi:hypothetical protein
VLDPQWVVVEGGGADCRCIAEAEKSHRRCEVSCFSVSGNEYLTQFQDAGGIIAWGRSSSPEQTAYAVVRWIDGASFEELYGAFEFVEGNRRRLDALLRAALRAEPELESGAHWTLQREMCDLHKLTLAAGERSVKVTFYGDNENPDAYLEWDGCVVADARVDPPKFGGLLKQWLLEQHEPSDLVPQHPNLKVRPVARFYEEGRGVEGEFLLSWNK